MSVNVIAALSQIFRKQLVRVVIWFQLHIRTFRKQWKINYNHLWLQLHKKKDKETCANRHAFLFFSWFNHFAKQNPSRIMRYMFFSQLTLRKCLKCCGCGSHCLTNENTINKHLFIEVTEQQFYSKTLSSHKNSIRFCILDIRITNSNPNRTSKPAVSLHVAFPLARSV